MGSLQKYKPSPSMVVALVALFVALSGVAYAGISLSNNTVLSRHIKNGEVRSLDLRNNAVNTAKIKNGTIASADLSTALASDLNDASTVGGLSAAQLVAAAGGKYFEATQGAAIDVDTLTETSILTLNLPEAGKYLINARMPVQCTYDGSDGAAPANPAPNQPFWAGSAALRVNGTQVERVRGTCEAEAAQVIVAAPFYFGTRVIEISRMIEVTGPSTVELRGVAETSIALIFPIPASARVDVNASASKIQAVSVRT